MREERERQKMRDKLMQVMSKRAKERKGKIPSSNHMLSFSKNRGLTRLWLVGPLSFINYTIMLSW